jgi:hypothetical protein
MAPIHRPIICVQVIGEIQDIKCMHQRGKKKIQLVENFRGTFSTL